MVDWRSQQVQGTCAFLFNNMAIFLLGGFSWYLARTWSIVEGALLRRRRRLSYTHIPYLVGRYGQLATLTLLTVLAEMQVMLSPTPCKALNILRAACVMAGTTLVAASTNLALRAYTLWQAAPLIKAGIILVTLGHLVFAILGGYLLYQPQWDVTHTTCNVFYVSDTMQKGLTGFYVFTTFWDWVILSLTIVALRRQQVLPSHSPLQTMLVKHGIIYGLITCVTCVPMSIVVSLNLNDSMNIFLSIPGSMVCVIASSAVVIDLLQLKDQISNPLAPPPSRSSSHSCGRPVTTRMSGAQLTTNIDV
ncbi:hypothetical protein BC629DRAFT_1434700 [Irpex lacteus]|nr:hypothetical protein BC629DRAFT_1434700 [Irpex lacteus]